MLHQLRHAGADEAKIIEQMCRTGRPIPQDILNAPNLYEGLALFYRAFVQLTSCRPQGMGEGPIPWTAICMWCNENDMEGHQRAMVFNHVRAMDVAYLQFKADNK